MTGQTLAVLLAGVALGKWWGGISMAIYAGLGMAGIPWFQGMNGGLAYLAGPTGGYIIGFILAALFLGYFTDKYIKSRRFFSMLGLMLFASLILVYVPGLLQLGLWLNLVKGQPVTFSGLMTMGALPFIAGDITKAVVAGAYRPGHHAADRLQPLGRWKPASPADPRGTCLWQSAPDTLYNISGV